MSIEELSTRSREELLKAPFVELKECTFSTTHIDEGIPPILNYNPQNGFHIYHALQYRLERLCNQLSQHDLHFKYLFVHQQEYDLLHAYFSQWTTFAIRKDGDLVPTTVVRDQVIKWVLCQTNGDRMCLSVSPRLKPGVVTILYAVENPPPKPNYVNVLQDSAYQYQMIRMPDITAIENINQLIFEQYTKNFPLK